MSAGKIHCCLCGVLCEVNDAAMCLECLRLQSDITQGIPETGILVQCGKCDRWMARQDHWIRHNMESPSLLAMCLKKIPGLQRSGTKIIDAGYIWTEPHSMRIKVFVNISRGILDDKIQISQKVVVEFTIKRRQCLECIREATDHSWGAMIQVRQHVGHKKSFYQLEQLLGDAKLHNLMLSVEIAREGMDFYFKSRNLADKVVNFISGHMPTKIKYSSTLVSQDKQSNTGKHEHTIHMEVIPLCKGDLLITPKEYTGSQELMLVTKLTSSLHLLNPTTMKPYELTAMKYFAKPIPYLMTARQLITFVVLDIRVLCEEKDRSAAEQAKLESIKELGGVLAEATVVRESDLGENDDSYITLTHLGHVLQPGDTVLGYDLLHSVMTSQKEEAVSKLHFELPDVVLVRKSYPESTKTRKRRKNKPSWMRKGGAGGSSGDGKRGAKKSSGDGDEEDQDKVEFLQQVDDETAFLAEENALFPSLLEESRDMPPKPPIFNEETGEWEDVNAGKVEDSKISRKTDNAEEKSQFLSAEELEFLEASLQAPVVEGEEDYEVIGNDDEEDEDDNEDDNDNVEDSDSESDVESYDGDEGVEEDGERV